MKFPFEVPFDRLQANPEGYISASFSCLESEFLILPKGPGFVEYPVFETGYEALKQATASFSNFAPASIVRAAFESPISIIVMRTMLGFAPPEWAYIATQRTGIEVSQFYATFDLNQVIALFRSPIIPFHCRPPLSPDASRPMQVK